MGLYVEIMCDVMKEWPTGTNHLYNRCFSNSGNNAQGHSIKEAVQEARRQGWLIRGLYAVCPNCLKKLPGEL